MTPHASPIEAVSGLTEAEVARRQQEEGYNDLPSAQPRRAWMIALAIGREPMFMLLVACGVIYLLLGDRQEALMLLGFVLVVMSISFIQQRKTERALEALKSLSSPRACVIRNGQQLRIPGREVVRDDLILLVEGDRVPADAVLLQCTSLTVDEALLTGESVPVRKLAGDDVPAEISGLIKPGGEDLPYLFSGTLVVQGKGLARVVAIAGNTAIGHIGKALSSITPETTQIQTEIEFVVKRASWAGFALAALVALGYGAMRGDWLSGFLAGLTLAMAILPEELPVVLTIFLGLGAWRMAQKNVLTRHVPAIEMLGAATVLCVDKTGTLTQNKMALARMVVNDQVMEIDALQNILAETFHATLEFAVLASHRDPFDPMEMAIRESGLQLLAETEHWHGAWQLVEEYPLSGELLAMSRVWQSPDNTQYIIAAKGAPEAIVDLCHLTAESAQKIMQQVNTLAEQGLRVLAVAKAGFKQEVLPQIQHDFNFQFLGLIALADPIRPAVAAAIQESHGAGLRVVMITGDYPATALNIAHQIGLESADGVITGTELDSMSDTELYQRIQRVNIFCRVVPEQKLRLVNAFKSSGEIVAMTGDGVNDAPALKAAHIGIAMGGRGTDVARESAALVLLDDDFNSIIAAVRLGRRIFENLRKAIVFVIAAHVPIIGLSLLPVMLGWPPILMPVHILFLQLIIDPVCSIVFEAEPEESDVMQRPPRAAHAKLFDAEVLKLGFMQGTVLLLVVLAIFSFTLYRGMGAEEARALTFTTLILSSIGLIFTNRSRVRFAWLTSSSSNPALWWVTSGAVVLLGLVIFLPMLSRLFSFSKLHWIDVGLCALIGLATLALFEMLKWLRRSST